MTTFGTLQKDGTVTNKIEVELNTVPSNDPLSFMYGVKSGQDRIKYEKDTPIKYHRESINHGSLYRDLSQEYLRGFLYGYKGILIPEGTKIKKGQETCLALLNLKIN